MTSAPVEGEIQTMPRQNPGSLTEGLGTLSMDREVLARSLESTLLEARDDCRSDPGLVPGSHTLGSGRRMRTALFCQGSQAAGRQGPSLVVSVVILPGYNRTAGKVEEIKKLIR